MREDCMEFMRASSLFCRIKRRFTMKQLSDGLYGQACLLRTHRIQEIRQRQEGRLVGPLRYRERQHPEQIAK